MNSSWQFIYWLLPIISEICLNVWGLFKFGMFLFSISSTHSSPCEVNIGQGTTHPVSQVPKTVRSILIKAAIPWCHGHDISHVHLPENKNKRKKRWRIYPSASTSGGYSGWMWQESLPETVTKREGQKKPQEQQIWARMTQPALSCTGRLATSSPINVLVVIAVFVGPCAVFVLFSVRVSIGAFLLPWAFYGKFPWKEWNVWIFSLSISINIKLTYATV